MQGNKSISSSLVNQLVILIYLVKPQKTPSNSSLNELAILGNLISSGLALPYLRTWRGLGIAKFSVALACPARRPPLPRAPSPSSRGIYPEQKSWFPRFYHHAAAAVGLHLRASHAAASFLFVSPGMSRPLLARSLPILRSSFCIAGCWSVYPWCRSNRVPC